MNERIVSKLVVWCTWATLALVGCGGGGGSPDAPAATQATVTGVDGASMDFTPAEGLPAAALDITRADEGAPPLPPGMQAAGAVYQFAPLGHVGSSIEIRVPFDATQRSGEAPRLMVSLPGEGSWSEVDAQLEGKMLRARVPALGYAVAARALSAAGTERHATSPAQPAQYLRGQLSAEPLLQGNGFLLTATAPSTATIRLDYAFAQSCAAPVQLRLRALVARSPSSTLPFSVRTVDLGSRALTARAGSESVELPLTAANNGTWVFLADARCIEQGRVRFGVLTALPVLVVKIVNAPPPPAEGSATIGAAGGFVNGPDGVRLAVPPAALESDITFRIARESSGAPPLPAGIDLASAVYAITPHGQGFAVSASVELPVSAALASGRPTFLMKAEPGGRWSVIASSYGTATTLRAGIDSLSYLAVGVCQNNLPAGSLFAQACPSSNQLSLELLLNGTTPVPISQDTTYGAPIPVAQVTTPETLTFRMTWTRPAGTNRVDTLDTGSGLSSNSLIRQAGFTFATVAPRFLQVNENTFSRTFTIDVDPTRVNGATGPNGVVRRIWAQAAFAVTGPGNVGSADWEFNAWVPIQVRSLATLPVIDSQPANVGVTDGQSASFSVAASVSPAATLSYQWARRASAGASFAPIAGATTPNYTLPLAQLADNGAQFQVEVCAPAGRCVTSNVATLTVTQAPLAPAFVAQPSDIAVLSGQTASFSVTASGRPLPRVEWQSAPASDPNNFTTVAGAPGCTRTDPPTSGTSTAATCTVGPLTLGDSGRRYRAVATNGANSVNSAVATLTVNAAPVAPSITQQPQPQTAVVGGSARFVVTASGTATLGYTWRLNGIALPTTGGAQYDISATCSGNVFYSSGNAEITLTNITAGCNGLLVTVEVSNGVAPNAASNGVTLTVNPATPTLALLAGALGALGNFDGSASAARFVNPIRVALDDAGNAYVADSGVGVRRVTPAGDVTTLTATRGLNLYSIARDPTGGFVLASSNALWRMTAGGAVTLLAGDPTWSDYVDAPVGTDARFIGIGSIVVDAAGNVFATETGNGNATIRRITTTGEVTTWAGAKDATPEVLDGTGQSARFGSFVGGLAFDANGNLYFADLVTTPPNAFVIRRISPQGDVTTVAGTGAALARAICFAFEPSGSLLAAGEGTLQRIGTDGSVTTLIDRPPVLGVQLGASPQLNTILGLARQPDGRLVLTSERAVLELTLP